MTKIETGRLLNAVAGVAEVDLVQIDVKDLLLRQVLLQSSREDELLDLAGQGALVAQEQRLHGLLGERGASALARAGKNVAEEALRDVQVIDAGMFEEVGVFRARDCLNHDLWDLPVGHDGPALLEDFPHNRAIRSIEPGGLRWVVVLERVEVRQIARVMRQDESECSPAEDEPPEDQQNNDPEDRPPAPPRWS